MGVAVSDPTGTVATPVTVLDARGLAKDAGSLRGLVTDYEAEGIVVGLPLTMSGEEGPQAASVRAVARRLNESLGVPIVFVDERLTTSQASAAMSSAGADAGTRRQKVDAAAATILLQTYLDSAVAQEDADE